jgi:hypothetical protein
MQNVDIKKLTYKGTLRQVFICLMPRTPYPPPPPPTHFIRIYVQFTFSYREGKRGESWTREKGNSSQSWIENTIMTDCISSLKILINTCRKVPLQINFFYDDILLWCLLQLISFFFLRRPRPNSSVYFINRYSTNSTITILTIIQYLLYAYKIVLGGHLRHYNTNSHQLKRRHS